MARPKSKEPTKDKIKTVRLNEKDLKKIEDKYGSIQKFLDIYLKYHFN